MTYKIQKVGEKIESISCKFLLLFAFLFLGCLSYYSMFYTQILQSDSEIPLTVRDNMLPHLLLFLGCTLIFFLLRTLLLKKFTADMTRIGKILIAAVTAIITVLSLVWVAVCHVTPRADGASVCLVAQIILEEGDYGLMNPPAYMAYNPHQYSLLAIIQLLFHLFGINNYQAFQYMNALCIPLLFYSGYKILMLIYAKWEPVLYYIALFISCLPLFLYIPYVYGEITSTAFTVVLMWQAIRYCKTGKKSSFIWGTLAIVFACIMRMNSLIVLIAVGIMLLIYAIRSAKWQPLVWLVVMVIAVFATDVSIRAYYEKVSNQEIHDGIPYISYVLMGLEDSEEGPGWFNGTNYKQLMLYNYDTELTAANSTAAVKERLNEFWNNKPYALDFFRRKILSQWNSPDYHSLHETRSFDCETDELPGIVRSIYYDNTSGVFQFMNQYQFLLYIFAAIMTVLSLFESQKAASLENYLLIIAILGGFLFSILWEAMSRYVISYVVYMIPLAAVGMWQLQQKLSNCLTSISRK